MVEKSDEFDECMLNRQNFSHQNFALGKFRDRYCIFVTGFVKIDPNHTGTEIHFIVEH